jgi:hypothetical protein
MDDSAFTLSHTSTIALYYLSIYMYSSRIHVSVRFTSSADHAFVRVTTTPSIRQLVGRDKKKLIMYRRLLFRIRHQPFVLIDIIIVGIGSAGCCAAIHIQRLRASRQVRVLHAQRTHRGSARINTSSTDLWTTSNSSAHNHMISHQL